MSVNRFKNGVLQKIAGAVGDAVPLINNFLTNQAGKGAADANTVYQLKNELDSLGGFTPIMDESGQITGYTTKIGGADTVFPFSGGNFQLDIVINVGCTNYTGTKWYEKTLTVTYINGEINYDETWQNSCTNTGSGMSWSTGVAKISSITYTAL